MRLGIKGKQVLGVTSIVGAVVVVLALQSCPAGAGGARGKPGARRTARERHLHRAREVVTTVRSVQGTRRRSGLRSILESALYFA